MLSPSWTFFRQGDLSFVIFTKYKEGVRAIRVIKYKKYVAGKYTRARAPLARENINRIFESKDGTTSMKIVNCIERHNICFNDLLNKFNRTEIRTYKVEERTFGTPCNHDKSVISYKLKYQVKMPSKHNIAWIASFKGLQAFRYFQVCLQFLIFLV